MDENLGHRFQFRLSDAMLAMTICCVVAAQVVINHLEGQIFGPGSMAGRIIGGFNLLIVLIAVRFYKSNRRRTLWVGAAAAIIATIVGVLIGKCVP